MNRKQITGTFTKSKKHLLWDDFVVDEANCTATKIMHKLTRRERMFCHDAPWESDICGYYQLIKVPDGYRLYYRTTTKDVTGRVREFLCMLTSDDGIIWQRPFFYKYSFNGSTENNIIYERSDESYGLDNFAVFYDENPNCPPAERFKALSMFSSKAESPGGNTHTNHLCAYTSFDGITFTQIPKPAFSVRFDPKQNPVSDMIWFDSLNVCFWDAKTQKYTAYVRGFHDIRYDENGVPDINGAVRDVRVAFSADFREWTQPQQIGLSGEKYPLYTSGMLKYHDVYIGFPVRYVEHKAWNDSFEQLSRQEYRRQLMKDTEPRSGLAFTDCVFMFSRDGHNFTKIDEAFITPGPEHGYNWLYGNCFLSHGYAQTEGEPVGTAQELSFYMAEYYRSGKNCELYRYTMRQDGFISRFGGYGGAVVTTKPFVFEGDTLYINFASSGAGHIKVVLTDADTGEEYVSQIHSGDSCKRQINFDKDTALLKDKRVWAKFLLKDAHIYSFTVDNG